MIIDDEKRLNFSNIIKEKLSQFNEVHKIILFGSFVDSTNPNDIDIAIIQNSNENFLSLSLKYRKVLRDLSKVIPLDIVPIKQKSEGYFLKEIYKGKVVYEKWDKRVVIVDSIYLSSKYPFGSVLPHFEPDENICV